MIEYKEQIPDINDYFNLFLTTGWNDEYNFSEIDLKNAIKNSWYAVSVYQNSSLIGFGRVIADGIHHALIVDLIIRPEYQNRKIGTQLLIMLLNKCKSHNIRDIQLFSAKDKFEFYEKFGFRKRPINSPGMQYVYENVCRNV